MISKFGENALANYKKENDIGNLSLIQVKEPMALSIRQSISKLINMLLSNKFSYKLTMKDYLAHPSGKYHFYGNYNTKMLLGIKHSNLRLKDVVIESNQLHIIF